VLRSFNPLSIKERNYSEDKTAKVRFVSNDEVALACASETLLVDSLGTAPRSESVA
jgi:hypothetical protein